MAGKLGQGFGIAFCRQPEDGRMNTCMFADRLGSFSHEAVFIFFHRKGDVIYEN